MPHTRWPTTLSPHVSCHTLAHYAQSARLLSAFADVRNAAVSMPLVRNIMVDVPRAGVGTAHKRESKQTKQRIEGWLEKQGKDTHSHVYAKSFVLAETLALAVYGFQILGFSYSVLGFPCFLQGRMKPHPSHVSLVTELPSCAGRGGAGTLA